MCKGVCNEDKFDNIYDIRRTDRDSFKLGYKRCRKCAYYIKGPETRCPCCNSKLAVISRNSTSKRLLRLSAGRY